MLSTKVVEHQDTRDEIASLADGLTLEVLTQALRAAIVSHDGTSPVGPRTWAGTNFWGEVVSQLREELLPKGWELQDDSNFALIISPCKQVQIACGRGAKGTGSFELAANPTTRSKRGPRTIAAIHANSCRGQHTFDFIGEPHVGATWFLLYERKGHWVFAELSLPGSFCAVNGRPDGWIMRIPLPPISVDSAKFDGFNGGPDFEVTVKRRP